MNKNMAMSLIASIIAVSAMVLAGYVQVVETPDFRIQFAPDTTPPKEEISNLRKELFKEIESKLALSPDKANTVAVNKRISEFENKISKVEEMTVGLREAINPTRPEEILTIARLTDEVKALKNDFKGLDSKLTAQQKSFQDSIVREIQSSSSATTLILVVLIPLVLNFLYTVWKDFRKQQNGDESPNKAPRSTQKPRG